MSLTPVVQTSFNSGEISPIAFGRSDLSRYLAGAATLENFVVQKQGGIARRSGTRFVKEVFDSADITILYPFSVSTIANYVIEFGDLVAKFYTDRGILYEEDGSTQVSLVTPWASSELRDLKFVQSADILYVLHPDHQPREIQRVTATDFQLRNMGYADGPYLDRNRTNTKFNLSDNTATRTVTAATQANPCQITATAHGFTTGMSVRLSSLGGMVELNGRTFTITWVDANNFTLDGEDSTGHTLYTSGGTATGWISVDIQDNEGDPTITGVNNDVGISPDDVGRLIRWIESDDDTTYLKIQRVGTAGTIAITSTTAADPVVVTATSHGLSNGDLVHIAGVATATALNDRGYIVANKTASTFELTDLDGVDIDGTNYGAGTGGTVHRADLFEASIEGADVTASQETRKSWALGAWGDFVGWPRCATIHQSRIWFAGTKTQPQTIWSSESGIFDQFSPTETTGLTVTDDLAITRTIDADKIHNIYHMHSHSRGLLVMTDGGEWVGSTSGGAFDPLSPTNFGLLIQSSHGSKTNVRSWQAGNSVLFPQFSGFKIREFIFRFEDDQFISNDLTELAEHIGGADGFVDSAYQEEPDPTLWLVRADGQLVGLTYDRSQKVFAFHRHKIGGAFKGGDAEVQSVAVIRDDPYDLLWLIVKRTINGATEQHIEYVGDKFEGTDNAEEAFYVDSGLASVDLPELITNITQADPAVVTATLTGVLGYGNGTTIVIRDVEGMTDVNGNQYKVANSSVTNGVHTFDLQTTGSVDVDSTGFGAYTTGGTVRNLLTAVSGLDHLEGETVKVAGDGAEQADQTVSSGSITLATAASIVYVGLENTSTFVSMPMVVGSGSDARTSVIRAAKLWVMMYKSQGGTVGQNGETLDEFEYDDATTLFTGIKEFSITGLNDLRFQIKIVSDSIQPMNILQIGSEVDNSPPDGGSRRSRSAR